MVAHPRLHAVVYAWPRVKSQAQHILDAVSPHVHRASVVLCADDPLERGANDNVYLLGGGAHFGEQFAKAIEIFDGDVLLQIAADVTAPSWSRVAGQCAARFQAMPNLGLWSPDIDGSVWPTSQVAFYQTQDPDLFGVLQTDTLVWAMRKGVVDYLKTLDYALTPLGDGIDWAAAAHAYANKLRVMRDLSVRVSHPVGAGHDRLEADRRMTPFLASLPDDEKIQLSLLLSAMKRRA
jgi:hypothetical protein